LSNYEEEIHNKEYRKAEIYVNSVTKVSHLVYF